MHFEVLSRIIKLFKVIHDCGYSERKTKMNRMMTENSSAYSKAVPLNLVKTKHKYTKAVMKWYDNFSV